MKKILFVLCLYLGIVSCQEGKKNESYLSNFIPTESAVVVSMRHFDEFSKALTENSFLSQEELTVQKTLQKKLSGLQSLSIQGESLLCFSILGRDVVYTFITENTTDLFPIDSVQHTMQEFQYGQETIRKHTLNGHLLFSVVLNDVLVASGSKLMVENAIRNFHLGLPQNASFNEVYGTVSDDVSIFVQNDRFREFFKHFFPKGNSSFLHSFSGWTALDVEVKENAITLNGILSGKNTEPSTLDFFKGIKPQKNQLAKVVPLNAIGFYAFTYHDFTNLQENLSKNREQPKLPPELDGLFASANEVGIIYFPEGNALAFHSHELDKTENALLSQQQIVDEFRGQSIFSFSEKKVFRQAYSPLIKMDQVRFYTRIGSFFIFSEEMHVLENIIAQHQNESVLATQPFFEDTAEHLSDESSILLVGINQNLKKLLATKTADRYQSELKNLPLHNYKLSTLQFVRDEGFTHMNAAFLKSDPQSDQKNVRQLTALKLENPLAGPPQFFEYWRTGEQYIVAQDTKNNLYLFDNHGKLQWKKPLNGRILESIKPVDLFKNTRLQMAFVTTDKFYVVAINGKDVAPFPLAFNSPITQPLSVFDYAQNRNYRFVITQGNTLSMWDNQGKKINGFDFEPTASRIVQAPNHIRIGTKDYIVVPEVSGRLNIIDREGKPRIKVKKSIAFSDNQWYLYKGMFTSTNAVGELIQIDASGTVSTKELDLVEDHHINVMENTLVSISENVLTINGKKIELDYGRYTAPQIFKVAGTIYIAITDTQASKVYLFDANAKLLPGFPVYGNSPIDLGNWDNQGKLEFIVKGEEDSVLVYQLD